MQEHDVVRRALRQLPDLEDLDARLDREGFDALLASIDGRRPVTPRDATRGEPAPHSSPRVSREVEQERERVLAAGRRAIVLLRHQRDRATLTRDEQVGLEAIVRLTARPAILIQDGRFLPPPAEWAILDEPDTRAAIERTVTAVGRIEVDGHPSLDWIGTGFLVAEDVVMTNRHVAMEFAELAGRSWRIRERMKVRLDYVEELGATRSAEFAVRDIIGVHPRHDLALLGVSTRGSRGARRPTPLPLAARPTLRAGRKVYVIGYPAADSRRNDPEEMRRIFANIYDVKRLQPGETLGVQRARVTLTHDCSTLGGNSGSSVVDLETHQVVGLHFGGRYGEANLAVLLSALADDPLVRRAGVEFA